MKLRNHQIKAFIMSSGERYCLLIDKETGLPLYYPNLFVTTQFRNHSKSVAAMKAALDGLNVFLAFCDEREIDLETRFLRRRFFELHELDAIRDYCQRRFTSERVVLSAGPVPISPKRKREPPQTVGLQNEYMRLTYAANYSKWLAQILFSGTKLDRKTMFDISGMEKQLKSRRPKRKGRNQLKQEEGLSLPLFPDMAAFENVRSVTELRSLFPIDHLHLKSSAITDVLQRVVSAGKIYSERTGELLNVIARRFRYTVGTRAAREGFGPMIIAELLDHSDTQNSGVYVKNIPEHASPLDALSPQLAHYAQAFQGVLVDREEDACRGNDPTSRIRHHGTGTGTCGTFGFCGGDVPVPCYTCTYFQPWVDGPHETVLAELFAERERVLEITGDSSVAAANDRTILAVAQVIQRCHVRREELARKVGE